MYVGAGGSVDMACAVLQGKWQCVWDKLAAGELEEAEREAEHFSTALKRFIADAGPQVAVEGSNVLGHKKDDGELEMDCAETSTPAVERGAGEQLIHGNGGSRTSARVISAQRQGDAVPCVPIGVLRTCFKERNGTPRQGILAPSTRGHLVLRKQLAPEACLDGVEQWSHVWIVFVFDRNTNRKVRPKVHPPRMDGSKVGWCATRTPHRPNALGLTLARVVEVNRDEGLVVLGGVDILDGTAVLDVKPYLPRYDAIGDLGMAEVDTYGPSWNVARPLVPLLRVQWSERALGDLTQLESGAVQLELYAGRVGLLRCAVEEVLAQDPRRTYQRKKYKTSNERFGFCIDVVNVVYSVENDVATVAYVEHWPNGQSPAAISDG